MHESCQPVGDDKQRDEDDDLIGQGLVTLLFRLYHRLLLADELVALELSAQILKNRAAILSKGVARFLELGA